MSSPHPLIVELKNRRQALGLSQREVAGRLGSPFRSVIGRWENGRQNPTFDSLTIWASALDAELCIVPMGDEGGAA